MSLPILVTGASGFLGRVTVDKLLQAGYSVYGCGQQNILPSHQDANYHFIPLDLRMDPLEGALGQQKFQAVVHLASSVPLFSINKLFCGQDSYLNGVYMPTLRLLKLLKNTTNHLILASSVAVYGKGMGCITESHGCCPFDYYGLYKWFSEELCRQYAAEYQSKLSILRFTQLYGPGEPHGRFLQRVFLDNARLGKPISLVRGGRDERDLLWIEDAADAILLAVMKRKAGTFNIANGKAQSIKNIAEMLKKLSHHSFDILLEDDGSPAVSAYFSIDKAATILGFNPSVPLSKGLERLYRQQEGSDERTIF